MLHTWIVLVLLLISARAMSCSVDHHDMWSFRDMLDALPLVGRCYSTFRRAFGVTSSWLLKKAFHDHQKGSGTGSAALSAQNGNGHESQRTRNYATLRL